MSVDVSAFKAKQRAARFATSFESTPGPAGVLGTRREPPVLSDKGNRILEEFEAVLPPKHRAAFRADTMAKLSGSVAVGAVEAAATLTAKSIVGVDFLRAANLILRDVKSDASSHRKDRAPKLEVE